jgi:hypothetical protein
MVAAGKTTDFNLISKFTVSLLMLFDDCDVNTEEV